MNTYQFKINAVEVHTQVADLEKVIYNVHWSYVAENEDGVTADIMGVKSISEPNPDSFTPFDQLVQADVISWIEPSFQLSAMQSALDAQIAEKVAPSKQTLSVPASLEETITEPGV
jgi:hypothetical protein